MVISSGVKASQIGNMGMASHGLSHFDALYCTHIASRSCLTIKLTLTWPVGVYALP